MHAVAPLADFRKRRPLYARLYFQVLVAAMLGVALGHFAPDTGAALRPLGELFIKLVRMMIAPIVFVTVVTGIAGLGNLREAGRLGLKAILYFELVSTLALVIGLIVGNLVQPGHGLNIDPRSLRLNFEVDIEVIDPDFADRITGRITAALSNAEEVTLEELNARPFAQRLVERITWLGSPYL